METRRLIFIVVIGLVTGLATGLVTGPATGLLGSGSFQAAAQEQKPYVGSDAFERMKHLVGSWEGTRNMEPGSVKIKASYRLTAGGSAIVETIFVGTPIEMETVYYDNEKRQLNMTHYCTLRNRPKMTLRGIQPNELVFDLSNASDIDAAKDDHMHSLKIIFDGKNKMIQHWGKFEGGKKKKDVEIAYTRIK